MTLAGFENFNAASDMEEDLEAVGDLLQAISQTNIYRPINRLALLALAHLGAFGAKRAELYAWPNFIPPPYDDTYSASELRLPDFPAIWAAARAVGYAVGLHGSMRCDCDLIAVPWTEAAVSPEELVKKLCESLNVAKVHKYRPQPHGHVAVMLELFGDKPIDLTITPRSTPA